MTKSCIVTTVCGDLYKRIISTTAPFMMNYALKNNADFIVISDDAKDSWPHSVFVKYRIKDLFDIYDRILLVDADMVISPYAPNLFLNDSNKFIAPIFKPETENALGLYEDVKSLCFDLNMSIPNNMINTSLMLMSKKHKKVFNRDMATDKLIDKYPLLEQDLIGVLLNHYKFETISTCSWSDWYKWQCTDPDEDFYFFHAINARSGNDDKIKLCRQAINNLRKRTI